MSFFDLLVRRPVAVWMVAIAVAVFGFVSYQRLPLNLMPDLSYPTITVRTEVPGAAPEEVESSVSRPIEEALATTEGLVEIESRSRAGMSDVVLQFTWGADMDRASQDVRERLQTTWLPNDAERPLILRYDPTLDPILRVALSVDDRAPPELRGPSSQILLREVAEREIKRTLEAMDGVAAVRVRGGLERQVLVEVREDWLAARDVTLDQLVAAVGAENVNLPGGSVYEGDQEYLVRTLNEVRTVAEIEALEILRPDGVRVPVLEVATVREGHKDREVQSQIDGRDAVELEIFKSADANVVRVARDIKARLGADGAPQLTGMAAFGAPPTIASTLPEGVTLTLLDDQAAFIESSLNNLRSTLLLGAVLAVVVLFGFLRDFRATTIIAAAIPLSIVCTFAPLYIGGVSLNLMSLGGLALGVGMLVDNAVVVLESIHVHREAGAARLDAAVRGVRDVAAAVFASTMTTVAVFLPIAFVEGVAGQIFGDLSLAVVFSLLASLAVALFFVPVLAAAELALPTERGRFREVANSTRFASVKHFRERWRARSGVRRLAALPYQLARLAVVLSLELIAVVFTAVAAFFGRISALVIGVVLRPLARVLLSAAERFNAGYERIARRYEGVIPGVLSRPGLVLGSVAAATLVAGALGTGLGRTLIPEVHQGRFTVALALPVGTPLGRTVGVATELEAQIRDLPDVAHVHATVGAERRADSPPDEGEHTARLTVQLTDGGDLGAREERVMASVRGILADRAAETGDALSARMSAPSLFSFETPVEVLVFDNDLLRLRGASDRVVDTLSGLGGLRDVRSSLVDGYPEVLIRYDRDLLQRFGLSTSTVARSIRDKVQGATATTLSRGDGRVDLVVRTDEDQRRAVTDLRRLNINPDVVPPMPLDAVATIEEGEGPSEIRRIDQRRVAVISANLGGFDLSGESAAIVGALRGVDLGGSTWAVGGQSEEMGRSMKSLQQALLLAVFLVYVIMASTFESIIHPFVILFSVPLALIGVVAGLFATATPVSVVVLIGAIVLAGVVVNNAIVLVDTINRQRAAGLERGAAIARAAALRLRPILITTLTTVLGLLPLALGFGEGAEVQRPLALTVILGLSSSTLLTLVVIPVIYERMTGALEHEEPAEVTETVGGEVTG